MPNRATALEVVQLGVETTSGTAVAATKRLLSLALDTQVESEFDEFTPSGHLLRSVVAQRQEWSSFSGSGYPDYNGIVYPLSGVIGQASITTPGGGTNSRDWTFSLSSTGANTLKTFTVQKGQSANGLSSAEQIAYGIFSGIELGFSRTAEQTMSVDGFGRRMDFNAHLSTCAVYTLTAAASPPTSGTWTLTFGGQTTSNLNHNATPAQVQTALEALSTVGTGNVVVALGLLGPTLAVANSTYTVTFVGSLGQAPQTLTGTFTSLTASNSISLASTTTGAAPTDVNVQPVLASHVNVYMDTASGSLGSTQLLGDFSADFSLTGRRNPVWVLDTAQTSFESEVQVQPDASFTLALKNDSTARALATQMRDGSTRFVRILATGPEIETGKNYTLTIDMAGKIRSAPSRADVDGASALEWEFRMVHDATWTRGLQIVVRNGLTAL